MKLKTIFAASCAALTLTTLPSAAHFQLIYADQTQIERPGDVPVKLIFWHPMTAGHVMDMGMPQEFFMQHRGERIDLSESLTESTFTGPDNTGVSFDGIVTEPCAWRIAVNFKQMGKDQLTYLADKMPAGGNLLEIRGLAGVFVDDEISAGIHAGAAENSQFKIVGSVHGDWAQDVSQKAVAGILPSLPVTQGGDGYGAAQAFKAAGRPTPLIIMGNRQDELQWWKEQKDSNGYETMSVSIAPGVSTLAFWVAQQILDGADVPKDLTVPFLRVDQNDLEEKLAGTEKGGVANIEYTLEDAKKVIGGM